MNLYIDTTLENGLGADKQTNPNDTILLIEPEIKGKTPVLGKIESAEFSNITIQAKNMNFLSETLNTETAFVSYGGLLMPNQKIINNISERSDQNINSYQIAMSSSKIKEVIDEPLVNLLTKRLLLQLEFGPQYVYRNTKALDDSYRIMTYFRTPLSVFPSVSNPRYYVTSFKIPQLFDLLGIEYNKCKFTNVDDPLFGAYFNIPVNTMKDDCVPEKHYEPGASNATETNWYNLRVWSDLTYPSQGETELTIRSEVITNSSNTDTPLKNVFISNFKNNGDVVRAGNAVDLAQQYYTNELWYPESAAVHYIEDRYSVVLLLPNNRSIRNYGLLVLDDMDIEYSQKFYQLLTKFYVTVCLVGYATTINQSEVTNTQQFLENFCGLKEVKFLGDYGFDKDGRPTTEPLQPDETTGQIWEDMPPIHIDAGSMLCFWPKDMVSGGSLVWRSGWESNKPAYYFSFGVQNTIMTNPSKANILAGITLRDVLNVLNYHSCGKLTITANMGVIDVNCFEYKLLNQKYPSNIITLNSEIAQNYKISPTHIQSTKDLNYLGGSSLTYTLADADMIGDCRDWLNNIGNWNTIYQSGVWNVMWYTLKWLTRFEKESPYTYLDNTSKNSPAKTVDICKAPYCIFYLQQLCYGVLGFTVILNPYNHEEMVNSWTVYGQTNMSYAYEIEADIKPSHLLLINNYYVQTYLYYDNQYNYLFLPIPFTGNLITDYNYKKGKATLKVLSLLPLFTYNEVN